eukprot:SAG11_NODE_23260_length_392_cov_0.529010_1_plen_124_part_10
MLLCRVLAQVRHEDAHDHVDHALYSLWLFILIPLGTCIVLLAGWWVVVHNCLKEKIMAATRVDEVEAELNDYNKEKHRLMKKGHSDILCLTDSDLIHSMATEMREMLRLQLETLLHLEMADGKD